MTSCRPTYVVRHPAWPTEIPESRKHLAEARAATAPGAAVFILHDPTCQPEIDCPERGQTMLGASDEGPDRTSLLDQIPGLRGWQR